LIEENAPSTCQAQPSRWAEAAEGRGFRVRELTTGKFTCLNLYTDTIPVTEHFLALMGGSTFTLALKGSLLQH